MENMDWQYNYTSRLYQHSAGDAFLSVDPYLYRPFEDKGWLPRRGIALDCGWEEGEWTFQERIEYTPLTKEYQVGTRKWRTVEGGIEFERYHDVAIHLPQHEKYFKEKGIPKRVQQNIADLFRELRNRSN